MPTLADKLCPRCGTAFTCAVGDIARCQCHGVRLSAAQAAHVARRYEGCLCRDCLLELALEHGTAATACGDGLRESDPTGDIERA